MSKNIKNNDNNNNKDKNKKCLSISSATTAYTSLYRGLKYLLKVSYIILDYLNVVGSLIFCLGSLKKLPNV